PIADRVVHLVPEFREDAQPPHLEEFAAGTVVFDQGARGELVYVIRSGTVEIIRQLADGGIEQLANLGPDDYFGELGPLLGFPRSATARATSDLVLTAYSVQDFREQVLGSARTAATPPRCRSSPDLWQRLRNAFRGRCQFSGVDRASGADDGGQDRLQLGLGLGQLGLRVGVGDHAHAGVQPGHGAVDDGGADADGPRAVPGGVDPTDRSGVAVAVDALL